MNGVIRRTAAFILFVLSVLAGDTARAVTIDWVAVGNPGNAGDSQPQGTFGAVGYSYRISKYEVTNAQYSEFLNAIDATGTNPNGVYNASMDTDARGGITFVAGNADGSKYVVKTGRGDNPVVFVSFFDAMRFTNWLENGQPTDGSGTESGVYAIADGLTEIRAGGASYFLPSEDEWYKAAYHKNDGVTGNFWDYPTSTDATPYSDQPPGSDAPTQSNTANFRQNDGLANIYDDGFAVTGSNTFISGTNYLTDVGAYTLATSPYGTFDQGGNVMEWNEAVILFDEELNRGIRGGAWSSSQGVLGATFRDSGGPAFENSNLGFRVALFSEANVVPEQGTLALAAVAIVGLLLFARQGRRLRSQ